ncbi:MAG: hypothetical protein ACYC3X_00365 [Pirellulaceae bacterium]
MTGWRALEFVTLLFAGANVVLLASCRPAERSTTDHVTAVVEHPSATAPLDRQSAAPAEDAVKVVVDGPSRVRGEAGGESPESAPAVDQATRERRRAAKPLRPGVTNDITFDDLELDMPLGTLFHRALLTPRAAQLDGQQVRLRGFIYAGGVFQQTGITNFPFVKNTQCKFGPEGLAFCVILVDLDEGVTTEFTTYPVTIEGRLSVRPYDSGGFTWSVYHVQGQRVF